jgi:hypothetical protein
MPAEGFQGLLEFRHSLRLEGVAHTYPDSVHRALSGVDVEFFSNPSLPLFVMSVPAHFDTICLGRA